MSCRKVCACVHMEKRASSAKLVSVIIYLFIIVLAMSDLEQLKLFIDVVAQLALNSHVPLCLWWCELSHAFSWSPRVTQVLCLFPGAVVSFQTCSQIIWKQHSCLLTSLTFLTRLFDPVVANSDAQ